jgi:NAD(P)-dependent dehydrogenase (short-subunit alcohol dehydrogenase family)
MNKLQGKVAVVTGGNSGIGLATAKLFAREGASVVISGRNKETLAQAAKEIGGDVLAVQADVSKLGEIDKLYAATIQKFGKIDVLFVNAGIFKGASLEQVDEAFLDETMDINFKGGFFTIQKALAHLNDGASIILNSTAAVHRGVLSFPISIYNASKAALASLAKSLSKELMPRKIRVNTVSPGAIDTPIVGRLGMAKEMEDGVKASLAGISPLNRAGTADEIAKAVLFLASDDSSFVIGEELVVDGGFSRF